MLIGIHEELFGREKAVGEGCGTQDLGKRLVSGTGRGADGECDGGKE